MVVGAGFAGLNAAKKLANKDNLQVVLIDHRNHHLFQPLLYQVATAGLNPSDIAVPIRVQFRNAPNVQIHLARVTGVDLERQVIFSDGRELPFSYLILACGARHSYFAHPEWEEFAPGLKTLEQATEMRRRMLVAFELAENEPDRFYSARLPDICRRRAAVPRASNWPERSPTSAAPQCAATSGTSIRRRHTSSCSRPRRAC